MEWTPFSNIRYKEKKRHGRLYLLFFLLLVIFLPPSYYYLNQGYTDNLLTTNIDFENKKILDETKMLKTELSTFSTIRRIYKTFGTDTIRLLALANPSAKYVKIYSGLRREEIADIFGKVLNWNERQKDEFLSLQEYGLPNSEGYYYPGVYILFSDTSPSEVADLMLDRFDEEVTSRYASSTKKIISVNTALKVASIIEREAAGKNDRRLISGIIWNRIFSGMNLEIDATLQYAKGSEDKGWWPKVTPKDKKIDSPYNTYQNEGFPPSPISNTSLAAIKAALNPQKTKCLFYIHDKNRQIHCAKTYEEHKKNVKHYLITKS